MYAFSDCAQYVAYYDDFYFTIGSAVFVLVIDVAVFVRLRMLSRSLQQKRRYSVLFIDRLLSKESYGQFREHCGNVSVAIPAGDAVLLSGKRAN